MTEIRVLYHHSQLWTPGGANRFVVETANRLARNSGFSITISTQRIDRGRFDFDSDVTVREYGGPVPGTLRHWATFPSVISNLKRSLVGDSFDVILYNSIPSYYYAPFLTRRFPDAVHVWYAHTPNSYLNLPGKVRDVPLPIQVPLRSLKPAVSFCDRALVRRSIDEIISNSKFTRSIIEEAYRRHSTIIYPGVDTDFFKPDQPPVRDRPYLFTVGQLNRYNNFEVLLRAMAELTERRDDVPTLVVAGEGEYRSNLRRLTTELDIGNHVSFVGHVDDSALASYYGNAEAVIYLPENEPFGLVPVEAMASGTPAIVSASGGTSETVLDGKTGIHVSTDCVTSVSDAIERLLADPPLRREMGENARKRAVEKFTWDETTVQLGTYFEHKARD